MSERVYSIRTHFIWLMLVPVLILVIALEAFFLHDRYVELDNDLLTRGQLMARQLAVSSEYGVFSGNRLFLNGLVESALQQPDVKGLVITDASGHVQASAGELTALIRDGGQGDHLSDLVGVNRPVFNAGRHLLLYQPILPSQVALDEAETRPAIRQIGALVLALSWEQTNEQKLRLLWFSLLVIAALLLIGLYLVYLTSRLIVDPVRQLSAAVRQIGAGDFQQVMTVDSRIEELRVLCNGFNQMMTDLKAKRELLQQEREMLQQRIDDATLQLRRLAFYDTLTLLPNRRLLMDRFAHELALSNRNSRYGALMFLDLDNFKPLNDQHGHAVGDQLLIEAGHRISRCLREVDTVARFGGDEFVILLSQMDKDYAHAVEQARFVAEKIRAELAQSYHLTCHSVGGSDHHLVHHCSCSIGIAMFRNHDASQDEILCFADAAMYQAKSAGRNRICFFDQDETQVFDGQLRLIE